MLRMLLCKCCYAARRYIICTVWSLSLINRDSGVRIGGISMKWTCVVPRNEHLPILSNSKCLYFEWVTVLSYWPNMVMSKCFILQWVFIISSWYAPRRIYRRKKNPIVPCIVGTNNNERTNERTSDNNNKQKLKKKKKKWNNKCTHQYTRVTCTFVFNNNNIL